MVSRRDGWQNVFTALGTGKDHRIASRFVSRGRQLDRSEIVEMYKQDAMFARIIDTVPEHATRRWIKVTGGDDVDDFGKIVMHALDDPNDGLKARAKFYELARLDRLDGGSAMIIGAVDGKSPDQPLDVESVESLRYLNVVSRYEITPQEIDLDPSSLTFRQPKFYMSTTSATGSAGVQRIHASRVIRLTGIPTNEIDQLQRNGWGLPLAERIYDACRQFGTAYDYAEAMFKDITQAVMEIENLNGLLASDQGQEVLIKRLQLVELTASAFNAVLVGRDEKYERRSLSFAGASDILVRMADKLSGTSGIPLSILLGQPPSGLSTDDKSGRTTFYDGVGNYQNAVLLGPVKYVVSILLASKEGPTSGNVPEQWDVEFLPLTEPTQAERATENFTNAQADEKLVTQRIISPDEARTRLAADPHSPYTLEKGSKAPEPLPAPTVVVPTNGAQKAPTIPAVA